MHPTEFGNLELIRLSTTRSKTESDDVIRQTWELAKSRNRFVWPLLVASLSIYFGLLVIVLSSPMAMSQSVYGEINVGLLAVCIQVVVTIVTFWAYCVWAAARFDGQAEVLHNSARTLFSGSHHV